MQDGEITIGEMRLHLEAKKSRMRGLKSIKTAGFSKIPVYICKTVSFGFGVYSRRHAQDIFGGFIVLKINRSQTRTWTLLPHHLHI